MSVKSFLRRLPANTTSSDEAIEVARKLGIDLPIGYTMVRGFMKEVYKKQ
jgi:hypothetical protein